MAHQRELERAEQKALAHRCVQGDQDAWRTFFGDYHHLVRAILVRRLRRLGLRADVHLVDDLAQEVFRSLLVHDCHQLRKFDPTRAGLSRFLALRVRDLLKDYRESRSRQRRQRERPLPAQLSHTDPGLAIGGLSLEEFVACLTEQERCFLLHELLGQTGGAAPRPSSPATHWRRVQALRRIWAAYCQGECCRTARS